MLCHRMVTHVMYYIDVSHFLLQKCNTCYMLQRDNTCYMLHRGNTCYMLQEGNTCYILQKGSTCNMFQNDITCYMLQKGNTCLHIASLAGHEDIVRILLEHKSKVNIQSLASFWRCLISISLPSLGCTTDCHVTHLDCCNVQSGFTWLYNWLSCYTIWLL